MNDRTAPLLAGALQLLGGLPLLAYPAVLIANVMQAAAPPDPHAPRPLRAIIRAFLIGSTAYPLVFLLCRLGAGRALARGEWGRGVALSAAPLAVLAALYALLAVWCRVERKGK